MNIPNAPRVPPNKDIALPTHVPNRKPFIIDNKEAKGKLHIIKRLYKIKNINIDIKKFLDMKFCIKSKLEKKVSSRKKSVLRENVIHKIAKNINKNKIFNFFENFII